MAVPLAERWRKALWKDHIKEINADICSHDTKRLWCYAVPLICADAGTLELNSGDQAFDLCRHVHTLTDERRATERRGRAGEREGGREREKERGRERENGRESTD